MNNKLICISKWEKSSLSINLDSYPNNIMYNHGTLNEIKSNKLPIEDSDRIMDMRKSAEAHKQVRKYVQEMIKPNMKVFDVCEKLENKIKTLFPNNDLKSGIGFPVSFSINNCVAHDSAIPNDTRIIKENDIIKVDFGTHVNGNIIDCAFTVAWNEEYKQLIEASKNATWNAIKLAGVDSSIKDISNEIKETIESYEVEIKGKVYQIKPVSNLGGHDIYPYKIHGGTVILCDPIKYNMMLSNDQLNSLRMKDNTCYAIETFATTGNGFVSNDPDLPTTLYSKNYMNNINYNPKLNLSKKLLGYINKTRSSLPFCTRWLKNGFQKYKVPLNELVKNDVITSYPPLSDIKDSLSSQLEHTIYLHEYGKEILSHGDDN